MWNIPWLFEEIYVAELQHSVLSFSGFIRNCEEFEWWISGNERNKLTSVILLTSSTALTKLEIKELLGIAYENEYFLS